MQKIIEVTGPPGSGKTSYVNNKFSNCKVISGFCPSQLGSMNRVWISITKLVQVWNLDISPTQTSWLIKQAFLYNETYFVRLNALRNSLLKFSNYPDNGEAIIVDEGISHIPFLFQLRKKRIQSFVTLFHKKLGMREIHILVPPSEQELCDRLLKRGHKRIKSKKEAIELVKTNLQVYQDYKNILLDKELPVKFIENIK